MKSFRFLILGLVILVLTGRLAWFAVSSYPQVKAIEEREAYLDSLEWYVEPTYGIAFSRMDYGCEFLIYRDYNPLPNLVGVISQEGREIIPCAYLDVFYFGGENFAALTDEHWIVFDFQGREITRILRDDEHLYYAGGTYFVRYPDFEQMGFEIVDGLTGKVAKSFDQYYSGIRLLDGSWYISKNEDVYDFDRCILDEDMCYRWGVDEFTEAKQTRGFFLDENFREMFDGQEYSMTLAGDGCYIADRIVEGKKDERVLLDQNGEVTAIPKESTLYFRTEKAFNAGESRYGLFIDGENIVYRGNWDKEWYGYIDYYHDMEGNEIAQVKSETNGLVVNYNTDGLYQIMDEDKNIILEPWFSYIDILADRTAAEVIVNEKRGIVKLKGGEQHAE